MEGLQVSYRSKLTVRISRSALLENLGIYEIVQGIWDVVVMIEC
jgi:hypothetical protein